MRSVSRNTYALFCAVVFAAMAIYSGIRLLRGTQYAGYVHSAWIDALLTAAWTSAAVAVLVRRERSVYLILLGLFTTFTHAFLSALALGWGALPYFVAFAVLTLCLRKSRGLFHPAGLFEPAAHA